MIAVTLSLSSKTSRKWLHHFPNTPLMLLRSRSRYIQEQRNVFCKTCTAQLYFLCLSAHCTIWWYNVQIWWYNVQIKSLSRGICTLCDLGIWCTSRSGIMLYKASIARKFYCEGADMFTLPSFIMIWLSVLFWRCFFLTFGK